MFAEFVDDHVSYSMEHHLNRISSEFMFSSNMLDRMHDSLPDFISGIKDHFDKLSGFINFSGSEEIKLSGQQKKVIEKASHLSFLNFGETPITVPENFKGNLLSYADLLVNIAPRCYSDIQMLLGEYNGILSSFITNKESKTSLQSHEALFKKLKGLRESREASIKHYFPVVNGKSRARMKDVLSRFSDLDNLFKAANSLSDSHNQKNLFSIQTQVQQSLELLGIIEHNVKEGQYEKVGPEIAMEISEGAYAVAKEVEFISAFYYQVTAFMTTMSNICEIILKA